jgi:hypothetical protein
MKKTAYGRSFFSSSEILKKPILFLAISPRPRTIQKTQYRFFYGGPLFPPFAPANRNPAKNRNGEGLSSPLFSKAGCDQPFVVICLRKLEMEAA